MWKITNISNHAIDLTNGESYDRLFVGESMEVDVLTEQMENLIDPFREMLLLEVFDSE